MESAYYRATGFSPYYFANIVFHLAKQPMDFLRNIEEILGDLRADRLCNPFPKFSILHMFAIEVIESVLLEDVYRDERETALHNFLRHN